MSARLPALTVLAVLAGLPLAARAGGIAGRVLHPGATGASTPVAGAKVALRGVEAQTTTDASGRFVFAGLADGRYAVVVDASGQGFGSDGVTGVAVSGGTTDVGDLSTGSPAAGTTALTGKITGGSGPGGGLGGAIVMLYDADGITDLGLYAVSADDGSYALYGLAPGVYHLIAGHNHHRPVVIGGFGVNPAPDGGVAVRDLDLPAVGDQRLGGFVGLSENPADKSGSGVRVEGLGLSATTDADGYYQVQVPAGVLVVSADHASHYDSFTCFTAFPQLDCWSGWRVVVGAAAGDSRQDFALLSLDMARVHVSGTVLDGKTGARLARVKVVVDPEASDGGDAELHEDTSDNQGHFDIGRVRVGSRRIEATKDGYRGFSRLYDVTTDLVLDQPTGPNANIALDPDPGAGPVPPLPAGCGCGSALALGPLGLAFALRLARGRKP